MEAPLKLSFTWSGPEREDGKKTGVLVNHLGCPG